MISEYPLWKSRKFWLVIMDLVVSIAMFFGGKYLVPEDFEIVKFLIGAIQPVFLMLIGAYTYQNVKLEGDK